MSTESPSVLARLQTPDEMALIFNPVGLGGRVEPEDAARFQMEAIAAATLVDAVPTEIRENFERARALSPRYANAHVGLADGWSLMASDGLIDPREAMPRSRDAANRALALDATLAPAHASLGRTAMLFDWDWQTSAWHFARALDLAPGDATTREWHAHWLSAAGRHEDAIAEARRAVAADPLSLNTNTTLGRWEAVVMALEGDTADPNADYPQETPNEALKQARVFWGAPTLTTGGVAALNTFATSPMSFRLTPSTHIALQIAGW